MGKYRDGMHDNSPSRWMDFRLNDISYPYSSSGQISSIFQRFSPVSFDPNTERVMTYLNNLSWKAHRNQQFHIKDARDDSFYKWATAVINISKPIKVCRTKKRIKRSSKGSLCQTSMIFHFSFLQRAPLKCIQECFFFYNIMIKHRNAIDIEDNHHSRFLWKRI